MKERFREKHTSEVYKKMEIQEIKKMPYLGSFFIDRSQC